MSLAVVVNDLAKSGVGILAGCDVMMPGFWPVMRLARNQYKIPVASRIAV